MKITNKKLCIGFPCSWPHIPFPFFYSFIHMDRPDFVPIFADNGPIDSLRNKIVGDAIAIGASHLIMMDLDQIYPVNAITKLLSHKLPIVGCLVHRRYPPFDGLLLKGDLNGYEIIDNYEDGELVEVSATGTGCLLFDMEVFRNMPSPWFYFRDNPDKKIGGIVGEDIGFCSELVKAGYKIYVDTSIKCGHLTTLVVNDATYRLFKAMKTKQREAALTQALSSGK